MCQAKGVLASEAGTGIQWPGWVGGVEVKKEYRCGENIGAGSSEQYDLHLDLDLVSLLKDFTQRLKRARVIRIPLNVFF